MSSLFARKWAMPSKDTFSIAPIAEFVHRYATTAEVIVDPFARSSRIGTITNDINPSTSAMHHMDCRDFLRMLVSDGVKADLVLFDPPYSPRQISECYKEIGKKVTMHDTQNSVMMKECRGLIDALVKPGGTVLSFGWNSTGMGRTYKRLETLLVCHGGMHNDTICVADEKTTGLFTES